MLNLWSHKSNRIESQFVPYSLDFSLYYDLFFCLFRIRLYTCLTVFSFNWSRSILILLSALIRLLVLSLYHLRLLYSFPFSCHFSIQCVRTQNSPQIIERGSLDTHTTAGLFVCYKIRAYATDKTQISSSITFSRNTESKYPNPTIRLQMFGRQHCTA